MAFALVKEMQADGLEWGEGYRPLGRAALAEIIQGRMAEAIDHWLDGLDGMAMRDRRNGSYPRHLLSELGAIELRVRPLELPHRIWVKVPPPARKRDRTPYRSASA